MNTSSSSLSIGQPVPDFSAAATRGNVHLSDYAGRRLVLYFYPRDNTPGCTAEAVAFRDHHEAFAEANTAVLGVSRDSIRSHEGFRAKLELPFDLISDPDETLCMQYGVMRQKKMYGKLVRGIERSTFLIDTDGTLLQAWRGMKVAGHVEQVLAAVQNG